MSDCPDGRWRVARDGLLLYFAVAIGTLIGGVLRAAVSLAAIELAGQTIPWGTFVANAVGSFVIGFYAEITGPDGRIFAGTRQRQFVMLGICGGFTTFSVFSLETFQFASSGRYGVAALFVGASVIVWLSAVWAGHALATRLNRLGGT